jgi:hypothetical protein
MLRSRTHCCNRYGWLYCQPHHYQSAFDEQIKLVNAATKADPAFSGEPPELQPWVEQQLRQLASDPFYAKQIHQRAEILHGQEDAVVQQLERTLVELAAKAEGLAVEREHLLSFLSADE